MPAFFFAGGGGMAVYGAIHQYQKESMIDHKAMKKVPQVAIKVIHHDADGLYTKEMHIPAGVAMGKEMHDYSHQSFLGKGRVRLIQDEVETTLEAPVIIYVKAGVWHTVIAETDAVWYCTHATDERINKL